MKITHHPEPESLLSCSAGSMPEAFAAVMASHIEMCSVCREELAWLDHVGTALLDSLPGAPVSHPAPVMAMHAGEALGDDYSAGVSRAGDVPGPLVKAVGHDFDTIPWERVTAGVWQHKIALRNRSGDLRLTKVSPGKKIPGYSHRNSTLILVLKGSCQDARSHFRTGDVAHLGREDEQLLTADRTLGCICLIAREGRKSV